MSVSTRIALRYLKNKKNKYLTWITALTIFGVSIGIATMIIVLSVIDGFENELRDRFLIANAHILAYRYPSGVKAHDKWQKKIEKDFPNHIKGTSPFLQGESLIKVQSTYQNILIKGIDPAQRETVQDVKNTIRPVTALNILNQEIKEYAVSQKFSKKPGIILGAHLIKQIKVEIGDTVHIIPLSPEKNTGLLQAFEVIGIYDSGLLHYDKQIVVLSIPGARKLLSATDVVTGIEVGLHDPNNSDQIASKMKDLYPFTVKEWKSYNKNVFEHMKQEKRRVGLIVWLVAIVASLNILTTLFITVNQKQKEISILKALGATNAQIMMIFMKQSTFIGFIGSLCGSTIAFCIGKLIEAYPVIDIPDVYLLEHLPVQYDLIVYSSICAAGIITCCLAGLYPAWAATRISPTEGFTGTRNIA